MERTAGSCTTRRYTRWPSGVTLADTPGYAVRYAAGVGLAALTTLLVVLAGTTYR